MNAHVKCNNGPLVIVAAWWYSDNVLRPPAAISNYLILQLPSMARAKFNWCPRAWFSNQLMCTAPSQLSRCDVNCINLKSMLVFCVMHKIKWCGFLFLFFCHLKSVAVICVMASQIISSCHFGSVASVYHLILASTNACTLHYSVVLYKA